MLELADSEDDELDRLSDTGSGAYGDAQWLSSSLSHNHNSSIRYDIGSIEALNKQIREAEQALNTSTEIPLLPSFSTSQTLQHSTMPRSKRKQATTALQASRNPQDSTVSSELNPSNQIEEASWLPTLQEDPDNPSIALSMSEMPEIRSQLDTTQPMFGDAGSTIPDDSSTERRLIQAALPQPVVETVGEKLQSSLSIFRGDGLQSSLVFPEDVSPLGDAVDTAMLSARGEQLDVTLDPDTCIDHEESNKAKLESSAESVLVLEPIKTSAKSEHKQDTQSNKKTSRKRKADEDELSSEGLLVGLPAEKYVPRPSKRRATNLPDIPVPRSTAPEKSKKLSRRKTTDAVKSTPSTREEELIASNNLTSFDSESNFAQSMQMKERRSGKLSRTQSSGSAPKREMLERVVAKLDQPKQQFLESTRAQEPDLSTTSRTNKIFSKKHKTATLVLEDSEDEDIIAVNAKAKVEVIEPAPLKEIKNEAAEKPAKRKRGKKGRKEVVAQDEEDNQDELASSANLIVSNKRSESKMLLKNDPMQDNLVQEEDAAEVPQESDDQPAVSIEKPASIIGEVEAEDEKENRSSPAVAHKVRQLEESAKAVDSSPPRSRADRSQPYPSPGHDSSDDVVVVAKAQSKVTTVQPQKSVSGPSVLHRVGLSKTRRIPSLLKIVRPPKK